MASTMANVVTLASLERTEEEQIDEEHILQAVSAKNSGKKEADEVLLSHVRLATEREAAIMQLSNIVRESNNIRSDLNEGTPPSSQPITEQVKQLLKFKDNAITTLDSIMATVCHLGQAIRAFKEKRGTAEFHADCEVYARKANDLDESGRLGRRHNVKLIDNTLKVVEDAKEKEDRDKQANRSKHSSSGPAQTTAHNPLGPNYQNVQHLFPSILKFSTVSLGSLSHHKFKVDRWLKNAFGNNPIPEEEYVQGFGTTIDEEFRNYLSSKFLEDILTKKDLWTNLMKLCFAKYQLIQGEYRL